MSTEKLKSEYLSLHGNCTRLCEALTTQVSTLLEHENITLAVPLETRVKTWDSIDEKITRKALQPESIGEIEDLVGLRIILLFKPDQQIVDDTIRKVFTILHSEDTSSRLTETQFGYQSLHYLVKLPDSWLELPSYSEFRDIKVEIQSRTVAQHIWAASSHKLQYKNESSVPVSLRRSIHRVSALLETVDLEFERLLDQRHSYVYQELTTTENDKPLNIELLRRVLEELLPIQNRQVEDQLFDLLVECLHFKIDTVGKLKSMIENHLDFIISEDSKYALENKVDHYFTHAGLTRIALRNHVGVDAFFKYKKIFRRRPQH